MKTIEVVAAILAWEGRYLAMQKGPHKYSYIANKFEFPGGKVEAGEDPALALEREILEEMELKLKIRPDNYLMTVAHQYPDFALRLHAYLFPLDHKPDFIMNEHQQALWTKPEELEALDWAEADRPIVKKLRELHETRRIGDSPLSGENSGTLT